MLRRFISEGIKNSGFLFPYDKRVTINLAPARKHVWLYFIAYGIIHFTVNNGI